MVEHAYARTRKAETDRFLEFTGQPAYLLDKFYDSERPYVNKQTKTKLHWRDNTLPSICMHTHVNVYFYTNAHLHIRVLTLTRTRHTHTQEKIERRTGKLAGKRYGLDFMVWHMV